MAKRAYGQYCGLAHALEVVGERWALLIVRDLLVGPKRFTDLHRGLPRIPTNILSTRLRELEKNGVVRRRLLPRPASSVVYELTEYGAELDGIVRDLGRWGGRSLGEPGPEDVITADSLVMALRSTFRPERAGAERLGFEVRTGEVVVHALVADGQLTAAVGPLPAADAVIEAGPVLRRLMAGEVSPAEALADEEVRVTGGRRMLTRFVEIFHLPPVPAPAAA